MGIAINERYEIRKDHYGWVLVEHVPKNPNAPNVRMDKESTWERHTFHPSPAAACRKILADAGGGCESAAEIKAEYERIESEISRVAEGIGK